MKITAVQGLLLSCPLAEPLKLPFWGGERTILKRDAMLIRVTTDTGLTGYAPGPAHEQAALDIRSTIAPFLEGKNPLRWRELAFDAPLPLVKAYRAVEIALMDIAGRHEGAPISELLGGRKRDRIKLYGSAGMYMEPDRYAEEAAAIQAMGFPAYKMRPGLGPDNDLLAVEKMRQATGPGFGLMIDAHTWWRMGDRSYTPDTIAGLAAAMKAHHPVWLEEPLPPEQHKAYRALKAKQLIPLASGEHEPDEAGFRDLIGSGAVDYIQMDVCCQGGFEMGKRVMDAAKRRRLRFAFHSWGTDLEVLAAAHLGICEVEDVVEWLEYPCYSSPEHPGMYPFPAAREILKEPLQIRNGCLDVPNKPGLGIEIDERVVEAHPYQPGPWSFFHLDSPPETVAVIGDHSVKWVPEASGATTRAKPPLNPD